MFSVSYSPNGVPFGVHLPPPARGVTSPQFFMSPCLAFPLVDVNSPTPSQNNLHGMLLMSEQRTRKIVGGLWARLSAGFRQDTYMYTGRVDKEDPQAVKWIWPSFEIERTWIVQYIDLGRGALFRLDVSKANGSSLSHLAPRSRCQIERAAKRF